MTFPKILNITLRKDKCFRRKTNQQHHKGDSPFLKLKKFDMVFGFPLDYMHLVLQGVMKKLLEIWILSLRTSPNFLKDPQQKLINKSLKKIRNNFPKEFERISRSLKHLKTWKAVEFRTFLLYTGMAKLTWFFSYKNFYCYCYLGPVLLKGILSPEKYQHFLYLHVAIRILASPDLHLVWNIKAEDYLKKFVSEFGTIYGVENLIFNIHSLIHLAKDAMIHGPLDDFSAFRHESFLGKLKKLIRSKNRPLAQLIRR